VNGVVKRIQERQQKRLKADFAQKNVSITGTQKR
jgi:hypothetical protein